jgi:hypothetical protein
MLNPEIRKVLAHRDKGYITDVEFAAKLGNILSAEEVASTLACLPADLSVEIKRQVIRCTSDNERLQPEDSPFDRRFGDYYRDVSSMCEKRDSDERILLSVFCLPSFQAEWGLQLSRSKKSEYALTLTVAKAPIRSTKAVGASQRNAPLSSEVAELVHRAWQVMLSHVRYPAIPRFGLDGVNYHFSCCGPIGGRMAGRTWSPDAHTAPGRLVRLSQLLFRYTDEELTEGTSLVDEIHQAASWFQEMSFPDVAAEKYDR